MDEEIIQNLNEKLDRVIQQSRGVLEDEEFQERVESVRQRLVEQIQQHPVGSIAAGLLAGYLIGKIFSSSD